MKSLLIATLPALALLVSGSTDVRAEGGLIEELRQMQEEMKALRGDLEALQERVAKGWSLSFHRCDGKRYHCTQRMCKSLCEARGERIATTLEVLGWSMFHRADKCAYAWMMDVDAGSGGIRQRLARLYPIYHNPEGTGCHRTKNETVLAGDKRYFGWETEKDGKGNEIRADCACTNKPL